MGDRASLSEAEHPPWQRLMRAFLGLLDADGPRVSGDEVWKLFFADSWFQRLVERRACQAVENHAVPADCHKDVEQTIWLLFLQKARKAPDLHVKREIVEEHFGGWIWSVVDDLGLQAIRRIHRHYWSEPTLSQNVVSRRHENRDRQVDIKLLVAELPILTQTILSLFDKGHTLTEIAELVGEKYWRVCQLHRNAIEYLRNHLCK